MPHGNLQYSQLPPRKRGWVAEQSYGHIFDIAERLDVRFAFEASGETLEIMEQQSPRVLEKLVAGVTAKRIEPVASPHTHIMLSNIRPEIGLDSLINGLDTWERICGVRPAAGWNPECSWASYIPEIYREAGFDILIADADSYLLSSVDGIREATGLDFDVRGHSNKNALFRIEQQIAERPEILQTLFRPNKLDNGLNIILRSDMLCNIMLWYLMGATEGNREEPVRIEEISEMLSRWKARIPAGDGFIMPYAEDAEYVGTTAYFYVKQFGEARFFEPAPDSVTRFEEILTTARNIGYRFMTPSEAAAAFDSIPGKGFDQIENGCAWHGGTAKAWANTVYSRMLDPVCSSLYDGLNAVASALGIASLRENEETARIVKTITTAYVSDSRWPPAPTSPGRFNVEESLQALESANQQLHTFMEAHGVGRLHALYSPGIMRTQIAAVRDELMAMEYFGENAASEAPGGTSEQG